MKSQKEVEGCTFEPDMATKKSGMYGEKRNLDKFLED